jgi:hypothetical protein
MTQALTDAIPQIAIALAMLALIAYAARVATMWHGGEL